MPIDIMKPFLEILDKAGKVAGANGSVHVPLVADLPLHADTQLA